MTEEEWLAGADPKAMLAFVRDRATVRKQRLFACGCCAQMWGATRPEEIAVRVIEMGERAADKRGGEEQRLELDEVMAAREVIQSVLRIDYTYEH